LMQMTEDKPPAVTTKEQPIVVTIDTRSGEDIMPSHAALRTVSSGSYFIRPGPSSSMERQGMPYCPSNITKT